ncbi:hypothetical protein BC834DRAFT_86593 [Gloeopeniophorella convolvens]|nr:hypothetical protein BC834DRAFT_340646 [Gloeopeniophorella convolvens]KAI0266937.1 hypothetical protein BC834DRAFT_86593 [Gloeopeniophorella convolvens]
MRTSESVVHDRVNLVRLARRLDKTVNQSDWGNERSISKWLESEGLSRQLKYARKLLGNVELYNGTRHSDIRSLLDRLDAYMLSVRERLEPAVPRPEPILPTVPLPPPSARKSDPPIVQRLAPPLNMASIQLSEANPAEYDLLPGSADGTPLLPDHIPIASTTAALLPSQAHSSISTASTTKDSEPAYLQHSTALQQELSAQLAQMAGQLRRNAEHFSTALAADQAVLRHAEEKIGSNYDVMKRERVRLRDHRGKSIGTTCLTLSSIVAVAIAFVVMFFVIRFT